MGTLRPWQNIPAAFALSKKDLPSAGFNTVFLIVMFFSGGLIPTYLTVKQLGFSIPTGC